MKDYVQSFVVIGLLLFGIVGISYHMFRDDGWIEAILGNVWSATISYPLIVIPALLAAGFFIRMWHQQRTAHGTTSKLADVFIWILMGFGAVFAFRWFAYGSM